MLFTLLCLYAWGMGMNHTSEISPRWPGTCYVDQTSLRLTEICLFLAPEDQDESSGTLLRLLGHILEEGKWRLSRLPERILIFPTRRPVLLLEDKARSFEFKLTKWQCPVSKLLIEYLLFPKLSRMAGRNTASTEGTWRASAVPTGRSNGR